MNITDANELIERNNKLLGNELKELMQLPYLFIKEELIEAINELTTSTFVDDKELMNKVRQVVFLVVEKNDLKITEKQFNSINDSVILSTFYNINDQLTQLLELEQEHLSAPPDTTLLQAGVMRLNQLGEMVTLMNLSKGDYFLAKRYGQLPYEEVFWLLSYNMISNDIEKKVNEIISKRNGVK
ncbi:hypothetical protein [Empedobacter sp. 189-2]|uniref:hypothetical protein n=1 Tax=Empedobacter sp. 189-2 TaxID=2746724 RepID=UPI0025764B83|nr:hypothetical protein [Empedobacter sp. 189-2]MDM1542352.1 hypothetical protein [Empedobacter sp. 189-2]